MKKSTVIGAGIIGYGIAELLALAGVEVTIVDINEELLKKAVENITWSLGKFVARALRFTAAFVSFSPRFSLKQSGQPRPLVP